MRPELDAVERGFAAADLDDLQPYTPIDIEKRMRWVNGRLFELSGEFRQSGDEEAAAIAAFKHAYASALIESQLEHEKKPASFHEAVAQVAAAGEFNAQLVAVSKRRTLKEEIESLRSAQMTLQSILKHIREMT